MSDAIGEPIDRAGFKGLYLEDRDIGRLGRIRLGEKKLLAGDAQGLAQIGQRLHGRGWSIPRSTAALTHLRAPLF